MPLPDADHCRCRWRFTVLEIQAVLVELIENFKFALPDEKPEIQRVPAGITIPMVKNKWGLGSQMPLRISPAKCEQAAAL